MSHGFSRSFALPSALSLILCFSLRLYSQSAPLNFAGAIEPASIEGVVVSAATGQPLKRAQVALEPAIPGAAPFVQSCDDNGHFLFPKVSPGRYSIVAQRDRYLPSSAASVGAVRLPPVFTLFPGQRMKEVMLRMRAWGVLTGKIRFGDAEPAVGVTVRAWRAWFHEGRRGYVLAASVLTNDLGEYRIYGLSPGYYFVAALYSAAPIFANAKVAPSANATPDTGYPMTFYPSATRLSDAVPVRINSGDEVGGNDIYLESRSLSRISGHVTSGLTGRALHGATVDLQLVDASGSGGIRAPVSATVDGAGRFEISGIPPGSYEIIASGSEGAVHLAGRRALTVAAAPDDSLELLASPVALWTGRVNIDTNLAVDRTGLRVDLVPRDSSASIASANVDEASAFQIEMEPGLTYDAYVRNAPSDFYISSVRAGGVERLASGLRVEPGGAPSDLTIELAEGARVSGRIVLSDGSAASGAHVALIPDPPAGRYQSFETAVADAEGEFDLEGAAPGRYAIAAWADRPPCDIYDPQSIPACRAAGKTVNVTGRASLNVQLPLSTP